jgi:thiamine biosynthesis lipoprotein
VADPFTERLDRHVVLSAGGVATSGIDSRVWRRDDGTPAHHVLDPSTGTPAWTGVVSATAIGRSCSDAERLAKTALLGGPERARRVLAPLGGVLVLDDGRAEWLGPLAAHERTAA